MARANRWKRLLDDGGYRALSVPAGRHEVVMRYRPPGLGPGLAVFAAAAAVVMVMLVRPPR